MTSSSRHRCSVRSSTRAQWKPTSTSTTTNRLRALLGDLLEKKAPATSRPSAPSPPRGWRAPRSCWPAATTWSSPTSPISRAASSPTHLKQFAQEPAPGGEGRPGHPVRRARLRLARQPRRPGAGDAAELVVPNQLPEAPRGTAEAADVESGRAAGAGRVRDHRRTRGERGVERAVRGPARAKLAHHRHRRV